MKVKTSACRDWCSSVSMNDRDSSSSSSASVVVHTSPHTLEDVIHTCCSQLPIHLYFCGSSGIPPCVFDLNGWWCSLDPPLPRDICLGLRPWFVCRNSISISLAYLFTLFISCTNRKCKWYLYYFLKESLPSWYRVRIGLNLLINIPIKSAWNLCLCLNYKIGPWSVFYWIFSRTLGTNIPKVNFSESPEEVTCGRS